MAKYHKCSELPDATCINDYQSNLVIGLSIVLGVSSACITIRLDTDGNNDSGYLAH